MAQTGSDIGSRVIYPCVCLSLDMHMLWDCPGNDIVLAENMAYIVRNVSSVTSVSQLDADALSSFTYPAPGRSDSKNQSSEDLVDCSPHSTECGTLNFTLGLYSLSDLPRLRHTTFLSFFSQIFGAEKYSHCVILTQSNSERTVQWVLYEATSEEDGKEGMENINQTLLPLVQPDRRVLLSEDLLVAIITPQPVPPDNLCNIVLELMENNPAAHPEWPSVVRAVLQTSKDKVTGSRKSIPQVEVDLLCEAAKAPSVNSSKVRKLSHSHVTHFGNQEIIFSEVDVHTAAREGKCESIRKILVEKASRPKPSFTESFEDVEFASLISQNDDEDVFDFDVVDAQSQDTPLYTSLEKGYIKSSLFFLLGGANPNFVHPVSGNTCLHLATEQGAVLMIKLLLVFYADPNIKNKKGQTPLDVLPDIHEYEQVKSMIEEVDKLNKDYEALPNDPVEMSSNEGEFLLSFDGGGSRCISEIQTLIAIEKRMLELNPNCKPFISHFDYLAGTSGGGFHVLTLVYNNATLKNDRALTVNGATYFEGASLHERTRSVESLIKRTLGDVRVMADVTTPRCIITSTLANTIPPKLHLITNYGEARDGQLGPKQRKIWEAARISSAAPTYLTSYQYFLDGGLMANNPAVDALVEMNHQSMKEKGHPLKLSCMLSLGSGQDKPVDVQNIDVCGHREGYIKGLASKVDGYKNLISLIVSQVTQTEGQDIARAKALCDLSGGVYYRLTAPIGKAIPLDTNNPVDLIQPMFDSFMFTLRNPQLIDSIARTLLSNPRIY